MTGNEIVIQSILQTEDKKIVSKPVSLDTVVPAKEAQVVQKEQDELEPILETSLQDQQKQLEEQVAQLNDYVQHLNRNLQFSVDEQSGQTVIKVIDAETKELVRQIPSQEIIDARNAVDNYRGLLLETKV